MVSETWVWIGTGARNRPLQDRGGRCLVGLLDPTPQGKKTPVPASEPVILLGLETIGLTLRGATMTIGAWITGITSLGAAPL